ncbi:uncharacterized protein LOC130380819 [Gadus chalcogrammus]|uniref:uncharacterized protein LOC130380819 n=1 Tax=Gadus chalcogrammus TaxID=1042646 RepID=UPI0024C3B03D|nr:uncharacterized protein LOC130380819 [Gadus chalcogrammus]
MSDRTYWPPYHLLIPRETSPKPAGTGGAAQHPRPPRLRERGYPDPTRTGRRESSDMRLRWAASTAEQRPTPQTALQYKPRREPSRFRPGWYQTSPCLLIGRDCPIFGRLLGAELRTPQPRHLRVRPRRLRSRHVYMAAQQPPSWSDSDDDESLERRDANHTAVHGLHSPGDPRNDDRLRTDTPSGGERESPDLIDFSDVPLAVEGRTDRGGHFATAQLEDDAHKHAWGHVQVHEGVSRDSFLRRALTAPERFIRR